MPTLVSTGQITIVDNNDARSITAFLTSNPGSQQVFTKDESLVSFTPDWFTANSNLGLILTPNISVAGLSTAQTWAALINKKFSLTLGGAALTTASVSADFVNSANVALSTPFTVTHGVNGSVTVSTLNIKGNLSETKAVWTVWFEADYVEAATGLVTNIVCQISLNTVKTGTNAVYLVTRGNTIIEESTGQVKNVTAMAVDLVRANGIDTDGLTIKWYETGGGTQISTSLAGYATKYGIKTTAVGTAPTGSTSDLGVGLPLINTGNTRNTLVISETAVVDIGVYKVEVTDSDGKSYVAYFTITDLSDPYDTQLNSSTGDKLQNGQGSTVLTPTVYNGSQLVTNLTGWSFTFYLYNKAGHRAGFIETAKIAAAGGGSITANTAGTSAVFNCSLITAGMFVAGSVIKCVKPNGDAFFYEVGATSVAGSVTIRTPAVNTWMTANPASLAPGASEFVGGRIFGCTTGGIRTVTAAPWQITVTGDDIDVKGRIVVESTRP